ncbi:hypothetical protein FKM82_026885 [Ascaphus truei]|uniref:dynein regulatory complex protein 10 n=1 Tax=Ascaphus truei TaxID=8439 RepID=UPI003F596658
MATEVFPLAEVLALSPLQLSDSPDGSLNSRSKTGQRKAQAKTDSMKMLEPGRKKLSTVETQRVVAVLDETIKNVELVSLFHHAADNLEIFSVIFGSELAGALREHQRLQVQLQLRRRSRVMALGEEDEGSPREERNMAEAADVSRNLALLRQGIQSSVKNTLRLFLANPHASKVLRAEGHVRDSACEELIQVLLELRGFLFEMLLTSQLEQNERMLYLQVITLRDRKNRDTVAALEEELNAAILDRDKEISKKNNTIRQLKTSLSQLEKFSDDHVSRTKEEADKQQKSDLRASDGRCSKLQQELQLLRSQLNTSITENREIELALRKKKYKVETEIENWIQKYDADMGEKQAELEELKAVYTEEKAELAEVQEKLAVLEVEYIQIMEERRLAQLRKEAAEEELANQTRAATMVQALWKGFQVRRTMTSRKRKKKKGKGKGKGKGKKGKK